MKSRNLEFMLITALLFISIILAAANYLDYLEFHIRVGPFFIHHWFSLIGSFYIGIYTPIYYYFKRKNPSLVRRLLMFHILGNVTSFGLILFILLNRLVDLQHFTPIFRLVLYYFQL